MPGDLFDGREVFVQSLSLVDEFHKIFHVQTFYLGAIGFLKLIILNILLLAQADIVEKIPILIKSCAIP